MTAPDTTTRLHAELIDPFAEPHVLVRGLTESTTVAEIEAAALEVWEADADDWTRPIAWRMEPCRLYRWVPAGWFDEHTRWLHWADAPGPGAFWGVECWPVHEGDDDA